MMAKLFEQLPHLLFTSHRTLLSKPYKQLRCFSAASKFYTDGVYQGLTAMRTRTPFIEAFRKQQENKVAKPVSTDDVERDLSPKSMSDSHHKVVCHMMGNPVQASQLTVDRYCHWLEIHGS